MTQTKKPVDYRALQNELELLMQDLQREDVDIDQALKQYQRGLELVKLLEGYLQTAANTVVELKAKFNKSK